MVLVPWVVPVRKLQAATHRLPGMAAAAAAVIGAAAAAIIPAAAAVLLILRLLAGYLPAFLIPRVILPRVMELLQ